MGKSKTKTLLLFVILGIMTIAVFLFQNGGKPGAKKQQESALINPDLAEGERLSRIHCARCHSYPQPGLLPKRTWEKQTLPHMGPQMGIFQYNGATYPVERTPNLPENYYPSEPQVSEEHWQKILDYYITSAPEELSSKTNYPDIITDKLFFEPHMPKYRGQTPPLVTSIRFDTANELIYLSDASQSMFHIFDRELRLKDRYNLTSAISDIRMTGNTDQAGRRELLTTYIGDVNPSDALTGFIQMVWYDPEAEQGGAGAVLYKNVARPVESQFVDLNQDGLNDLLISEFGHRTGGLFWLKNNGNQRKPDKRMLIETPGCIEAHVLDYNGNGYTDILALCTQLEQSIFLFQNQGNGNFLATRLLRFPVTAGSSSFKMYDFNSDGHLDILYTSGDNADYSQVYKPYHGVYIYLNDGKDSFFQEWFYPMDGAYHAIAGDFDKDGNPDIAAISFFANYEESPEESFLFFKGNGSLSFIPYHHPAASAGRWIAMDVADWNGDGYDDIVLANFSEGPTRVVPEIQNRWKQGPHFLLLENTSGFDED